MNFIKIKGKFLTTSLIVLTTTVTNHAIDLLDHQAQIQEQKFMIQQENISKNKINGNVLLLKENVATVVEVQKEIKAKESQIKQNEVVKQQLSEAEKLKKQREYFYFLIKSGEAVNFDLRTPSGLTAESANQILKGTGLQGLGKGFVDAERKNGVNAYYLMAHAAWESGWGSSDISKNKNNLFGFTAYDKDPTNSAAAFQSKEQCIDIVAKYVKEHYLNDNGKYNNGPNLKGMNELYATDKNWADGISSVIISLVNKNKEKNSNTL